MPPRVNKIVVYTAITNNYDDLRRPKSINPAFDYVCFSDAALPTKKPWVIRHLDGIKHLSPAKQARYIKTHPHALFPHEIAIWCDANILITGDLMDLVDKFNQHKSLFSAIHHPHRDCIYAEAKACKQMKKDTPESIDKHIAKYRKEKYPEKNGLYETGFFITRPHDPKMKETFDIWWEEIKHGSHRDQLSQMYAFRKTKVKTYPILRKGFSVRNHPSFSYNEHGQKR